MVVVLAIFPNLLLATTALAGPNLLTRNWGVARAIPSSSDAGASLTGSGDWTNVTATIGVPQVSVPTGGSGPYSGTAWVGIGGKSCGGSAATLTAQTGLSFSVDADTTTYGAWCAWNADSSPVKHFNFSDITFKANDQVRFVLAVEENIALSYVENLTTNEKVAAEISLTDQLCKDNRKAEWIVGLPISDSNNGNAPIIDFDNIVFSGAKAANPSTSAGPADIFNGGQGDAEALVKRDGTTVTVEYIENTQFVSD